MWDATPGHATPGAATPGRDTPGHAHDGKSTSRRNRWDETPKTERGWFAICVEKNRTFVANTYLNFRNTWPQQWLGRNTKDR